LPCNALQFGEYRSERQEHWGQFGDYVGGVLNPFVALFALIMLIVSVRLQSIRNLKETRNELKAARGVADEQRVVMQRQLFESQFFGTLRLLIDVTTRVKSQSGHADFVSPMGRSVGLANPFLEA
jgi:hypothetical protein